MSLLEALFAPTPRRTLVCTIVSSSSATQDDASEALRDFVSVSDIFVRIFVETS